MLSKKYRLPSAAVPNFRHVQVLQRTRCIHHRSRATRSNFWQQGKILSYSDPTISPVTLPKANASAAMPLKRSELYLRLMLQHGRGYPLYEPNPDPGHRRTGVRVGDIGWI